MSSVRKINVSSSLCDVAQLNALQCEQKNCETCHRSRTSYCSHAAFPSPSYYPHALRLTERLCIELSMAVITLVQVCADADGRNCSLRRCLHMSPRRLSISTRHRAPLVMTSSDAGIIAMMTRKIGTRPPPQPPPAATDVGAFAAIFADVTSKFSPPARSQHSRPLRNVLCTIKPKTRYSCVSYNAIEKQVNKVL